MNCVFLSSMNSCNISFFAKKYNVNVINQVLKHQKCMSKRKCSSTSSQNKYKEIHRKTKLKCQSKKLPQDVNLKGVFACNELDLSEVKVYGFDYDYTLAHYKPTMEQLLYKLGQKAMVEKFGYPAGILNLQYRPGFAIRGLHYDIEKGLLLKLDSFLQIQFGSVYRGHTHVSTKEVLKLYKNRIIPIEYVEGSQKSKKASGNRSKMVHLADLFSVPEVGLLCSVVEYFIKHKMHYHPEILFRDVETAVRSSHPVMHKLVIDNVNDYIVPNPDLKKLFIRLRECNKKIFLITNSHFPFVDPGMTMLVGKDWRDHFDLIIVNARKPSFFTETSRPLRMFDKNTNKPVWDKVTKLEKGVIYAEGTVKQVEQLTGWSGQELLYLGDHPYTDLADVTLEHGWRTGAIVNELTHEISTINIKKFKETVNWLQMLTQLIEDHQDDKDPGAKEAILEWLKERDSLRNQTKSIFNPQFGSVFRTYHNPTYFSRRMFRFADIYTANVSNLLNYSHSHIFYPRRGVMPHEYSSYFV